VAESKAFYLYKSLPIWAQNACCSLAGLKMRHQRYNRTFHEFLSFLDKSQWWSLADLQEFQNDRLRIIIEHAYATVPYYREIMDERKLTPSDFKTIADLPKLPILSKETLRRRYADLISQNWPTSKMVYGKTGGTTGTALKLCYERDTEARHWALVWRGRKRWGINVNDEFISFAGRNVVPLAARKPPFWRRNLPYHQTYVSVHHMSRENLPALAEYLCRRQVAYYSGYPSGIYLIAKYFVDHNLKLPQPPKLIITGSETLLPHQRDVISKAFDAPVTDYYGASECCVGISTCPHNTYHVDMEFAATEFLPVNHNPGLIHKVICTGFWNLAMPLIRYDIGDLVKLPSENAAPCSCGLKSPIVESIDGRIESYILTPDGRQLGRLDFLFKQSFRIKEAQLLQHKVELVTVKLVKEVSYNQQDEQKLLIELRKYLGDAIAINFDYVTEIPRNPNGKFRQIVSTISNFQ
jgi:phenylacetate-CoA ligase